MTPRAAAFALLGMINWIYQWYRPDGKPAGGESGEAIHGNIFPGRVGVSQILQICGCAAATWETTATDEFLRVPAMSAGIYVLPAGATDKQTPHQEDEIYYVVRGKAKMRLGREERSDQPRRCDFRREELRASLLRYRRRIGASGYLCSRGDQLESGRNHLAGGIA